VNREAKIAKVLGILDRALGVRRKSPKSPPLETALHAILAPGNRDEEASTALNSLRREFVDWNEVRVSSWKEIGGVLERAGIQAPGEKSIQVKKFLESVFNKHNKISLDSVLTQKPEDARRSLESLAGIPEHAVGAVMHFHFGLDEFHATPGLARVARRVGLLKEGTATQLKKELESRIPRKERFRFQQHLGHIAHAFCLPSVTLCTRCPLSPACPHGADFKRRAEEAEAKAGRADRRTTGAHRAAGHGKPEALHVPAAFRGGKPRQSKALAGKKAD